VGAFAARDGHMLRRSADHLTRGVSAIKGSFQPRGARRKVLERTVMPFSLLPAATRQELPLVAAPANSWQPTAILLLLPQMIDIFSSLHERREAD
jgi:hypothetical protein